MRKIDQVKHEGRRQEILVAASRCFARNGFHGATIADICTEAKMSSGHLYHYFSNKEEIIGTMAEAAIARTVERLSNIENDRDTLSILFSHIDEDRLCKTQERVELFFDVMAEANRNPVISEILQKHSRAKTACLASSLRQGQQLGQIDRSIDPDVTAAVMCSVIDSVRVLRIRDPDLDLDKAAELLKTLISRLLIPLDEKVEQVA